LAYVTLQGEGAISVINMQTLQVSHKIPTLGLDTPHNLDITDDNKHLWVRDFIGHVGLLDLKTEKVVKTFKVGNGHGGIDILPGGHLVATGAISDLYVTIINADELKIVARPNVGTGPHGVRASADGRFIYASVTADNTIAVIDAKTFKVVHKEPVDGDFPFWIAVPGNH
jgi:DNA-binding beta-propeller fold protein YncE